ncbi:hypothetical protein MKEN_00373100 [Mycena kentingensis (nom. inval.)]|nr:hypothetical protein MKEN_00373100 [Mycena kentingensis (nom. inval.)]
MADWSILPPEIGHEIANHNVDDLATLRSMCRVSKAMRRVSIEPLFSVVRFACVEDLSLWVEILQRTPTLNMSVRRVKFSGSRDNLLGRGSVKKLTPLHKAPAIPHIPAFPLAHAVEWSSFDDENLAFIPVYMVLFPNVRELQLSYLMELEGDGGLSRILASCPPLTRLVLTCVSTYSPEPESELESDEEDTEYIEAHWEGTVD